MAVYDLRLIEMDIVDMRHEHVDDVASLILRCTATRFHRLLGQGALADAIRQRCLGDARDRVGRVGIRRSDGNVLGFWLSVARPNEVPSRALLTSRIILSHLTRRVWVSPLLWWYAMRWIGGRLRGKLRRRGGKEPGSRLREASPSEQTEVIVYFVVDPGARFSNVGFDLMRDFERQAQERGATRVSGLVSRQNRAAQRMYSALGWVRTSAEDAPYDSFWMHKVLVPPGS